MENKLLEALLDMCWQHASYDERLYDSGLSANEFAFSVLGLENGMTYDDAKKAAYESTTPKPMSEEDAEIIRQWDEEVVPEYGLANNTVDLGELYYFACKFRALLAAGAIKNNPTKE